MFVSYKKLASEVVVGDLVWRAGQYWRVYEIVGSGGTAIEFRLRGKSGARITWAYRGDYDVAVGTRREVEESDRQ
jgi:hypothetical protein